ncbi:putative glucose-6-phosphate 1-epimerase isoform X1 [Oryza sativa Japonica Group]|uniref:putative glucose-6-phosphate 1-epimerase isoform X1 n=1 Tax=Oryza sativa subsp. japonica TaxID=39947 RepID=UPI000E1BC90D|nr:putative glucose-6-phosphate 1-epimerase isoform X1 [Oryza sativa Japonica Group]XP_025880784.1 putative glucose-6-phosphate 1-epimerase isoform X1 [Oryza sativa Japonica Group]XP_025880785.1 putative glucose-6-phosphate 1-epimerase isoform X1 [Oryza sativa Japonica Group]
MATASWPPTPRSPRPQAPSVERAKGPSGLDKVVLREARGFSAEVHLYGGQVTSWKNDRGDELLFVSSKATFKPPKAIRGGIPICFPQFGTHGILEKHGFARNRFWAIDDNPPPFPTSTAAKAFVDLILKTSEEDLKIWPHRFVLSSLCFVPFFVCMLVSIPYFSSCFFEQIMACSFEFRLRVALGPGGDLALTSRIRNTNTDGRPFSFTFAYHTYFSVSDISEVRIEGLETLDYIDCLRGKERSTEQGDAIVFESEVDKIYLDAPAKIAIIDHEKKRTFVLRKDGLPDAVLWNPWDKRTKNMQDFGDEEYKHMLCVEPAAVEKPITLKPGEEWKGKMDLSAVPSSYCSGQLDPNKVLQG